MGEKKPRTKTKFKLIAYAGDQAYTRCKRDKMRSGDRARPQH